MATIHGVFFQSDEPGAVVLSYNSRILVSGSVQNKARTVTLREIPASIEKLPKMVRESLPCACRLDGSTIVAVEEAPKKASK